MSGFARRLQQGSSVRQAIAGNILAKDDFNRADGSLGTADLGGAWTTHVGALTGTPAWAIASDAVAVTAAGGTDNWLSATLPLSVATGTIFCDFYLSPTNANTGICTWSSSDGNTYLNIQLNESVTYDRIALSKRISGTTTWLQEIDNLNFGNGVGYSAAVVFTATNVKVYLDGQQYIDYDLTAQDQADLASGTYPGLRSWFGPNDDDGGSRWDRFLVTDSTSPPLARVPAAPWNVTAVNGGDGQADISWGRAGNGGTPLTGYVITSSDGPSFNISDPEAISFHATGLNNVPQTFTVQAVNSLGSSDPGALSARSNSATPAVASVPDAPTNVVATAGNASAPVTWAAPASDGGAPITSYTVTSSPGSKTATSTTTSATVTGLTNGTAYTFTVTATNSAGTSAASSPSNSVTPAAPSGSTTYGPLGINGTRWVTNTPGWAESVPNSVEVDCSWTAISSAISSFSAAQVNAGARIMIRPGTLTGTGNGSGATPVLQDLGSTSWSQRILIRPRDGYGSVNVTNGARIFRVHGVTFAGFTGGRFMIDSCINFGQAWCKGTFYWATTVGEPAMTGLHVVELVSPGNYISNGDVSDCWPHGANIESPVFEGLFMGPVFRPSGGTGHCDTIQFEPFSSGWVNSMLMQDCVFFGSKNSAVEIAALQNATVDHCYIVAQPYATGRYPYPSGSDTSTNAWAFNGGHNSPNLVVQDSVIIGAWKLDGTSPVASGSNVTVNAQPSYPGTYNVYAGLTDDNFDQTTGQTRPGIPDVDYQLSNIWVG